MQTISSRQKYEESLKGKATHHRYYLKHKADKLAKTYLWRKTIKGKESMCKSAIKVKVMKQNIMHELKINGCAICGYDRCDAALEFHHVEPKDKKFRLEVGSLTRTSTSIANELTKCVLLCANCHREIHQKEKE